MKQWDRGLRRSEPSAGAAPIRTLVAMALLCTLGLVLLQGCGDDEPASSLTETERRRLRVDPKVGEYMARSQMAYTQGNINLAFALIDSVLVYAPDLADPYFMRGQLFARLNQPALSTAEFERVLLLDPEYRGASYNMGMNSFQGGRLREAISHFKREEALEPTDFLYLEMGKVYARLGEPDSARMAYENAIELEPTNASAYMWLGQLLEETGDLEAALEYSLEGARIKPDDPDYEYIIGSLYFRQGDNQRAVDYLQPVADALPWHQGAQYNLGQALLRLGRENEAQPYLAQADSAQQMQQALNEAQAAAEDNPDERDNWVRWSEILWKVGQQREAIDAYQVAISIDPVNFAMQTNLANMLIQSGDVEAGISRLQSIVRVEPAFIGAWLNLGAAYANVGAYDRARTAWESALERDPGNAQARQYLRQLAQMERANG